MSERKIPERTCLACRQKKPKKELMRVVKSAGGVHLDFTGKAEGRGAYLCREGGCLKRAIRYKLLNKAFSAEVGQEVYGALEEEFREN